MQSIWNHHAWSSSGAPLHLYNTSASVSCYLGDVASSGGPVCSTPAPCLGELGTLWPKAAASTSGSSVTTESVWMQISGQVAPTARTSQWGMLNASGHKNPSNESRCPFIHSFPPGSLCEEQVCSLSPPGEQQIPRRSVTRLPLSVWVCVCAATGWWAVFAKQTCTHREGRQTIQVALWDTGCSEFGFFLQSGFKDGFRFAVIIPSPP